MVLLLYYIFFLILVFYIYRCINRLSKKLNVAIVALRKIASTDYDMNKLVVIAIKALKDIDKI